MRKHKLILTLISVLVLSGIFITALAVAGGKKPDISAGKAESLIADRIAFSLENTEFTIKKADEKAEKYTLTMFFETKKTQGDFYAVINSLTLSGIDYESITFTALSDKAQGKTTDALVLTATKGEPDVFRWQVDITLNLAKKGTFSPKIKLSYTSGTTKNSAMEKFTEIPLKITVK